VGAYLSAGGVTGDLVTAAREVMDESLLTILRQAVWWPVTRDDYVRRCGGV
jgi:hypothetical protein